MESNIISTRHVYCFYNIWTLFQCDLKDECACGKFYINHLAVIFSIGIAYCRSFKEVHCIEDTFSFAVIFGFVYDLQ